MVTLTLGRQQSEAGPSSVRPGTSWHLLKPPGTLRGASSILIAQSNASMFSCHSNSNPLDKEVRAPYSSSAVRTEAPGATT